MSAKSCFFIGHANTSEIILPSLCSAIEKIIEQESVSEFYVGNHGNFDAFAIRALREAKRSHPQIRCFLVTAYHPGSVKLETPAGFDGIFYPLEQSVPPRFALPKANRAMVKQCNVLIAAVRYPGRSRDLLECAQRREAAGLLQIINLYQ